MRHLHDTSEIITKYFLFFVSVAAIFTSVVDREWGRKIVFILSHLFPPTFTSCFCLAFPDTSYTPLLYFMKSNSQTWEGIRGNLSRIKGTHRSIWQTGLKNWVGRNHCKLCNYFHAWHCFAVFNAFFTLISIFIIQTIENYLMRVLVLGLPSYEHLILGNFQAKF